MRKQTTFSVCGRLRRLLLSSIAVLITVLSPVSAFASFTGPYSPDNFTLTNSNADGSAVFSLGGQGLGLTGGNNGTGVAGQTDFTTLAAGTGLVQIQWLYGSLDIPGADMAGFLVGNTFTLLSDTAGGSGTTAFQVLKNQLFGFRVWTSDNTYGPGMLQITAFDAPVDQADTATPEPGTFLICALGLCAALSRARRLTH